MDEMLIRLKEKINEHKETYYRNEAAVRRQLIDPILDALGWSTDDPSLVRHNEATEDRDIPDYSLMRNKKVETYVEAKNLSSNIIDHLPQLARYCINNGKEFGIITNGNDWLLIKTFEKDTKPKDRIIWQISLAKDSITTIKSRLSNISKDQIGNLPELIAKEKQIQKFWDHYVSDETKIVDKLSIEISAEFLNTYPHEDYDQETIINFFRLKFWSLLNEREIPTNNIIDNKVKNSKKIVEKNNYSLTKLKKTSSPSARDWVEQNPDLRNISGLNSWQSVCDHLGIPVESDSARRKLKIWVEQNRKNWVPVPEPKR